MITINKVPTFHPLLMGVFIFLVAMSVYPIGANHAFALEGSTGGVGTGTADTGTADTGTAGTGTAGTGVSISSNDAIGFAAAATSACGGCSVSVSIDGLTGTVTGVTSNTSDMSGRLSFDTTTKDGGNGSNGNRSSCVAVCTWGRGGTCDGLTVACPRPLVKANVSPTCSGSTPVATISWSDPKCDYPGFPGATNLIIDGSWVTSNKSSSGSYTWSGGGLSTTHGYIITCEYSDGYQAYAYKVDLGFFTLPASCVVAAPPPSIGMFTNNGPIAKGSTALLSWSGVANATYCSIDNGIGAVSFVNGAGSYMTGPLNDPNITYTLTCSGKTAPPATKQTIVQVVYPPPRIGMFTNNGPIAKGSTALLSWSGVANATYCSIDNGIGAVSFVNGAGSYTTGPLNDPNITYTLTCSGKMAPPATKQTIVEAYPPPSIGMFTNNGPIAKGSTALLSWSGVANATYCSIDNGIGAVSFVNGAGSYMTGPLNDPNITYTLTCSGKMAPPATKQTTVVANQPFCSVQQIWNFGFWTNVMNSTLFVGDPPMNVRQAPPFSQFSCTGYNRAKCVQGSPGMDGGTTITCSGPSASFDPPPPSCSIYASNTGCDTSVSWISSNVSKAVLTDCSGGWYASTGPGPQRSPIYIPYNSGCYQIRDGSVDGRVLATTNGTSSCASGTSWNGSQCAAACPLPWGGSTPSGSSVTAYQTPSVISPATCVSENRTCMNGALSGSYANQSCTVVIPPVITSFKANPSTIDLGQTSKLTWTSTGTNTCIATGGFGVSYTGIATNNTTGVIVSPNSSPTTTYEITCKGAGGSVSQQASVTVNTPTASITASPSRVKYGDPVSLTWKSTGTKSCTESGPGLASTTKNGTQTVTTTSQSSYTITCLTNGSPVTDTTVVNSFPAFQNY